MTHRGPFQPLPFCDSVICLGAEYAGNGSLEPAVLLVHLSWAGSRESTDLVGCGELRV